MKLPYKLLRETGRDELRLLKQISPVELISYPRTHHYQYITAHLCHLESTARICETGSGLLLKTHVLEGRGATLELH